MQLTHLLVGHSIPTSEFIAPHGSEGDGRITDRGIFSLIPRDGNQKECKLLYLDLTNTLITDRALSDLSSTNMSLTDLIVRGTKTTVVGCMNFLAAKPNCVLLHDNNNPEENVTLQAIGDNNEGRLLINQDEHPWWNK